MLNFLSDHLAILVLLALTVIAVLLLAAVVWAAGQGARAQQEGAAAPVAPRLKVDSLKQSFRRAVELVEAHLATRSQRYDLAWTLVLNEGEGELPLAASGIPSALSADAAMSAQALGISWNFFDKGLAVQLQGAALGSSEDAAHGTQVWDELLGLCRNYRPDRPLDAIVLTLPARLLMPQHPQDQLDLAARARAVHRRLWLAQNRFALQFPIYLVVRGCEDIPGFARFARALPEPMRRSMLGWSSPFELSAPFQAAWIDAAMDDVARDVQDACAELCAMELPGSDSAGYFMLPAELERLRPGLRLFMEELMRPSAYHEPFVLHGLYFAGDCSEAAVLRAAGSGWPATQGPALPAPEAGGLLAPVDAQTPALVVPALSSALEDEPAFLREVFEKKVFAETGLVRASRLQRTRRPALGTVMRWTAVAVPAVWIVGVVVAGVRLHHLGGDMVAAVRQLEREARVPAAESTGGDSARDRERALAALALMERVDAGALGSLFMPGSWEGVDELHAKLRQRLDRGFGDNALEPIRLGAYARIAELTGVPLDAASGRLIEGAACALPAGWQARVNEAAPAALNPEELPEFAALLQFMARAEELDQALRAMDRLATGREPPQAEDLRRVVRSFLGAELAGSPARAAAVLREQARRSAPLAVEPMRRATACSFELATRALHERLFARNALLLSQQEIAARLLRLKDNAEPAAWTDLWQQWQELLAVLRRQEALLGPGKGSWMRARSLQPGPAWEGLLQRAQGLLLVGREPVAAARTQAQSEFGALRAQWEALLPATVGGPDPGLRWMDKDNRWAFTDERAALQAALAQLATEPFVRIIGDELPQVPAGASVAWDKARLDQALQVGDIRKRFLAEQLPRFPAAVRQDIELVVRAALADTMVAQLAQAVVVLPRSGAAPRTSEAERLKLARARVLLEDLGATGEAEQLATLQARDALARLRVLDEGFAQAGIYQPRDTGFRDWQGEKSPLAIAFGTGDASGLAVYAAQQQAFIDASAREAEALLQLVEGPAGEVAQRWRAIVADVARYRLKSPASSLGVLEQFVVAGASELDLSNCAEKLPVTPRRGGDPFAERLGALQMGLAGRCRELRSAASRDAWSRFAQAFNRELAGRSPFRPTSAPGERPPADVEEAGAVLKTFGQAQHLLAERTGASASVRRFGEQMERVRAFMAPLFPADEATASGYDLSVEFRANAGREVEGNKIIEWQLTVGTQTLRQHEAPRPLRWEPGQPVVVMLRLANDAPVVPRPDPSQPAMSVHERTVRYRFDDPWALYTLIATRREPEGSARGDARSQLLRLDFPLAAADDKSAAQPERATVFLRLGLSPVGKRTLLAWPGGFPARAPEWGAP